MRIHHAQPGMVLAQDVVDNSGTLLLEKGIALTETYIQRLKKIGIVQIRIQDGQAATLKQQKVIPDELRTELELCFRALFSLQSSRLSSSKLTGLYFRQVSRSLETVIEETEKQFDRILNVQIRQPSENEMIHSINVCLMSLVTGIALGFSRLELHDLALGALLHDIGKSFLPKAPQNKTATLDLHTLYGRNLLLQNHLSPTVARIAAEHHEAHDGSGFPKGLKGPQLHPSSQIVHIANYFDNSLTLAAERGIPFHEVMEGIMAKGNTVFPLKLLQTFTSCMPIYPVGSLVLLSNEKTAYVMKNQPHFPLHPLVRVSDDFQEEIDLSAHRAITIKEVIEE